MRLVTAFAGLRGSESEAVMSAHGLGQAYNSPGRASSKLSRINSALRAAEARGDINSVLDFIEAHLNQSEGGDAEAADSSAPATSAEPDVAKLPFPRSEEEQIVLQAVWDLFYSSSRWPTFNEVDSKLDRDHDLDIETVAQTMPRGMLLLPSISNTEQPQPVQLTIAGASACRGSGEEVILFLEALRIATTIERDHHGHGATPQLTSDEVRESPSLPAAGRDDILIRLGLLLATENWGWTWYDPGDVEQPTWVFKLDRRVRRYRQAHDLQEFWSIAHPRTAEPASPTAPTERNSPMPRVPNIFLVHGHDKARHEVRDFLRDAVTGVNVEVLRDQPSQGRTIIEKFEDLGGNATCAVVLLTPDDMGRAVAETVLNPRARQNVILELGYFIGKLGRKKVIVLIKGDVEKPSDVGGVAYIDYPQGNWKHELSRELAALGLSVNH